MLEPHILRNQHQNPIQIPAIEVHGIRVTHFSATIHTDDPASQVQALVRATGMKREAWPGGRHIYMRNMGDMAMNLTPAIGFPGLGL